MGIETNLIYSREALISEFTRVRSYTETLCSPLTPDDYQIQFIAQTSPPKWHIAHVTWFFEAFVLPHFKPNYRPYHSEFDFIFNCYHYTHGQMYPRPQRGMFSRPTIDEVYQYRAYVNSQINQHLQPTAHHRIQINR